MQKDTTDSNQVINQNSSNDLSSNENSKIDEDLVANMGESQLSLDDRSRGAGPVTSPSTQLTMNSGLSSNDNSHGTVVGSGAYVNPLIMRDSNTNVNANSGTNIKL
jgi:hypothetical protein